MLVAMVAFTFRYLHAVRKMKRMIAEGGTTPEDRVAWGFRRATGRKPQAVEVKLLADGLARRTARFRQSPAESAKILTPGEARPDPKLDPVELASYAVTANILLNLDEVITRE